MLLTTPIRRGFCLLLLVAPSSQAMPPATEANADDVAGHSARAATSTAEIVPTPTISSRLSSVERWHLNAALATANERLAQRESCRALFDGLDLEPAVAVGGTIYEPAPTSLARVFCNSGVVALTVVRGQRTRLCAAFGHLSRWDMAATLIHEAMHRAGQRESPPHAGAPTSREINKRVREACAL